MIDLIRREKRKYTVVKRDRLSIKEKLIELKNNLSAGNKTTMDKLINWGKGKDEVVITFISLLELARLKKLEIFQNEPDGMIYVDVKESLDSFDVETADGFEPEEANESISDDDIINNNETVVQVETKSAIDSATTLQ
jgi:segregation and condensation protein A